MHDRYYYAIVFIIFLVLRVAEILPMFSAQIHANTNLATLFKFLVLYIL